MFTAQLLTRLPTRLVFPAQVLGEHGPRRSGELRYDVLWARASPEPGAEPHTATHKINISAQSVGAQGGNKPQNGTLGNHRLRRRCVCAHPDLQQRTFLGSTGASANKIIRQRRHTCHIKAAAQSTNSRRSIPFEQEEPANTDRLSLKSIYLLICGKLKGHSDHFPPRPAETRNDKAQNVITRKV